LLRKMGTPSGLGAAVIHTTIAKLTQM